jgi:hypothetical protein
MTKFNFYDKKCHDELKNKNILAFDAVTIFKKNKMLKQ